MGLFCMVGRCRGAELGGIPGFRRLTCPGVLHPLDGVLHQRRGAAQLKLLLDAEAVRLNGLDINVQLLRDLARGQAMSDQLEHLKFSVRLLVK